MQQVERECMVDLASSLADLGSVGARRALGGRSSTVLTAVAVDE